MLHMGVRRKLMTDFKIGPMAITHQMGTLIDMAVNDRLQCGSLFIVNGHGPHGAMALNSDQYSLFGGAFATLMGNPWYWAPECRQRSFHQALRYP